MKVDRSFLMPPIATAVVVALSLVGCASAPPRTQAQLTFKSLLDGAELFGGGKLLVFHR